MKSLSSLFGLMALVVTLAVATAQPWQHSEASPKQTVYNLLGQTVTHIEAAPDGVYFAVYAEPETAFNVQLITLNGFTPTETTIEAPLCLQPVDTGVPFSAQLLQPPSDTATNYTMLETVYYTEVMDTGELVLWPSHEVLQTFTDPAARDSKLVTVPPDTPTHSTTCTCNCCNGNRKNK